MKVAVVIWSHWLCCGDDDAMGINLLLSEYHSSDVLVPLRVTIIDK